MQAYTNRDRASNPVVAFTLHPQQPRTTGDLDAWVTRALASVKPWRWSLAARLARAWDQHGRPGPHPHSIERWGRESDLKADLDQYARLKGGHAAHRLPGALGLRAKAVLHQLARLIEGGDWWKPRSLVDRATGEVRQTLYLPEDTWSAQTALAWCIERLTILCRAAVGMTEKPTPRSSRQEPVTSSERRKEASRDGDEPWTRPPPWLRPAGAQPELPATS
jgi:hypothetical protein